MNFAPSKIQKIEDEELKVVWEDGHESEWTFRLLRQICPCALCRDEFTGRRILDPDSVVKDLRASSAEKVGNYALGFRFSDGHASGVYSFEMLRKSCSCALCQSPK